MADASMYSPKVIPHCLQDKQVGLTQSFRLLLLPWVLEHVRFYVYPLRAESLFLTVCGSPRISLLAFKAKHFGGLSSYCRTLG